MYIFILIADNNKDLTKYIETPFTLKSRQVLPSDFFFCFSYGKLRYVFGIYNSIKYSLRTKSSPSLDIKFTLNEKEILSGLEGDLYVHIVDIYGKQRFYKIETSP